MSGTGCLDRLDFFPRNVETLTPIPGNLLSTEAKDKSQSQIWSVAGRLMVSDHIKLQNFRGKHPLKSDQNGVVTSNNGFSNYSF